MKNILRDIFTSVIAMIIFAVVLCGIYPVLIWGIGELVFPFQTNDWTKYPLFSTPKK